MFIPDLAPYVSSAKIDALSGLEPERRIFIKQFFSRSFYNFKCNGKNKRIVLELNKLFKFYIHFLLDKANLLLAW